ncbi:MAG: 1,4-dihydroxy-2-naphthoate octaprenyltransferase [Bacteroidales bacterium]|nr:1,4-dihydroxy-2-naphthoate octaprenyltransferase [Bacteroidales bacterium]
MATFQSWIKAARLRTLPLALSSIAMGGFLAAAYENFNLLPVLLAGLTTLFLQILSNMANDYGDSKSGIDNQHRLGPARTVQSGEITLTEMKAAVLLFALLSFVCGLALIFLASGLNLINSLLFLFAGISAIGAAINYTVGKNPYGYAGFGDLFVFLFFGLAGVCGTYFLATKNLNFYVLLPASAMGLLSTGVLNLNNMRDMANDRANQKNTIVVKIGFRKAYIYHCLIVLLPFVLLFIYSVINFKGLPQLAFLLLLPLFILDLVKIRTTSPMERLDPFLKKLAFKTLLLTVVFGFGNLI